MRWNLRQSGLVLMAIACIAVSGCVDQDVLESGYFNVRIVPSTAAGGANYDCILMDFGNFIVRAADGKCDSDSDPSLVGDPCGNNDDCSVGIDEGTCSGALAGELYTGGIKILDSALPILDPEHPEVIANFQATNVSLTGDRCRSPQIPDGESVPLVDQPQFALPSMILSSGTYFVDTLAIRQILLVDDTAVTVGACDDIDEVDVSSEPIVFKVGKDQPNVIRIVVDTAVLSGLTGSVDCADDAEDFLTIP